MKRPPKNKTRQNNNCRWDKMANWNILQPWQKRVTILRLDRTKASFWCCHKTLQPLAPHFWVESPRFPSQDAPLTPYLHREIPFVFAFLILLCDNLSVTSRYPRLPHPAPAAAAAAHPWHFFIFLQLSTACRKRPHQPRPFWTTPLCCLHLCNSFILLRVAIW